MDGNGEVYFDKTLSLVATMYQDNDGNFQDKYGKFIFRSKSKSGSYKGLGMYDLPLHYYATRYQPIDETLILNKTPCDNITAFITIIPKILEQSDDAMSNVSGCTDLTSGAADFSGQMSDAGSDVGDTLLGDDDEFLPGSGNRLRTISVSSDNGSPPSTSALGITITKSKSGSPMIPIQKKGTPSPVTISGSPNGEQLHSSHIYSCIDELKPISDDSEETNDEMSKDNRVNISNDSTEIESNSETLKLKKELEEMTLKLVETKLQVAELTGDVVQDKKKISDMEKLLVSQSSSEVEPNQSHKKTKKSSKWGIFCCASENSVIIMNPEDSNLENENTHQHEKQKQPKNSNKEKKKCSTNSTTKSKSPNGTNGTPPTKSKITEHNEQQTLDSNSSHGKMKGSPTVSTNSTSSASTSLSSNSSTSATSSSSSSSSSSKGGSVVKKEKNPSSGKSSLNKSNHCLPVNNQNGNTPPKPDWLN
eukprot:CAMPEP_0174822802 /NCGR_PEP_ID=MMETSP1107-20130205/18674_1 /TAXON_ID=36770 /ORGANISM="Paraphysomonas vestita, Strain GFlagA" /LENGTH=476 /DNA_ID=CAMNT_0016042881 /DNA_START=245 /DNA_END=1675 /DNA_ORIENTATION=+